jgi:KamA family protein
VRTYINRLKPVLILHTNHAQEIDHTVQHALTALKQAGVTLLNQAVLLRGVNDNVEALVNLSETLFAYGVMPYYLHLLDKVQGAAHFDLPLEQAVQLHQQLQLQLPGYLVPKLVREIAGEGSKTLIS